MEESKRIVKKIMDKVDELLSIASLISAQEEEIKQLKSNNPSTIQYHVERTSKSSMKLSVSGLKTGNFAAHDERGDREVQKGSRPIKRKDGRYMSKYYDQDKKPRYVYGRTKQECITKLRSALAEVQDNSNIKSSETKSELILNKKMSVDTWYEYWVSNYKQPVLRKNTMDAIKFNYYSCISKTIGSLPICSIDAAQIRKLLEKLPTNNKKNKAYSTLKSMFALLKEHGYITINPVSIILNTYTSTNKYSTERKNKSLTREQENTLLKKLSGKWYYLVVFLLNTGVRIGEALALQKKDIDWEKSIIQVSKQMNRDRQIVAPKSKMSIRIVPLFTKTKESLEKYGINKLKDDDYLFEHNPRSISSRFIEKTSGLGFSVNLHALRHTFATRCYEAKIDPKVVQKWMGHAQYSTTIDIYTDTDLKKEQKEMEKMNICNDGFDNLFDNHSDNLFDN